jgi:hypothetical protein
MDWKTTYPTMEAVNAAACSTLYEWDKNLPEPQTDVERTIKRRIKAKWEAMGRAEIKEKHPDIAGMMNDIIDKFERVTGGRSPVDRY